MRRLALLHTTKRPLTCGAGEGLLAEAEGFEPPVGLTPRSLSRRKRVQIHHPARISPDQEVLLQITGPLLLTTPQTCVMCVSHRRLLMSSTKLAGVIRSRLKLRSQRSTGTPRPQGEQPPGAILARCHPITRLRVHSHRTRCGRRIRRSGGRRGDRRPLLQPIADLLRDLLDQRQHDDVTFPIHSDG